ncbi:hypothetical protein LBMAG27_18080 [Bacteroidota bacterium]|nr:hypothetical protein LBMAG27_18080 [Bacteroidota bacterium]
MNNEQQTTNTQQQFLEREKKFLALRKSLHEQFGKAPDMNAMLFLIGVRELGKIQDSFTKEEKQDLMHIATCRLLSDQGYFSLEGLDDEGWPHWVQTKKIPVMTIEEQEDLLKECIINYFERLD